MSRIRTALIAVGIAFGVGLVWVIVARPFLEEPSNSVRTLWLLALFSVSGFVTGAIQRSATIVSVASGVLFGCIWAEIVGPHDPWMVVWRYYGVIAGGVCGGITGFTFQWLLCRALALEDQYRSGATASPGSRFDAIIWRIFSWAFVEGEKWG